MGNGRKCQVCGWKDGENSRISFFALPKTPERKTEWLKRLGVKLEPNKKSFRVCSKHFSPKQLAGPVRLKKKALPRKLIEESQGNNSNLSVMNQEGQGRNSVEGGVCFSRLQQLQPEMNESAHDVGTVANIKVEFPLPLDDDYRNGNEKLEIDKLNEQISVTTSIIKSEPPDSRESEYFDHSSTIQRNLESEPEEEDETEDPLSVPRFTSATTDKPVAKASERSLLLRRHIRTGGLSIVCRFCQMFFTTRLVYEDHFRIHTMDSGEKPYKCESCGKSYSLNSTLLEHALVHSEEKIHKCVICEKTFKRRQALVNHERLHSIDKPYECEKCGKRFTNKPNWILHNRLHTGEKPFSCVECGMRFPSKPYLNQHSEIHTKGEKSHNCEICGKYFEHNSYLTQHKKLHLRNGVNPYECDKCGMRFAKKATLIKHQIYHSENGGPIKCTKCEMRFPTTSVLTIHMNKIH